MNFSNFYHIPVRGDGACFFHSILNRLIICLFRPYHLLTEPRVGTGPSGDRMLLPVIRVTVGRVDSLR